MCHGRRVQPTKEDEDIILCIETTPATQLDAPSVMKRLTSGRYSIDSAALPDKIVFMKLPRSGRQLKINKQRIKELVSI